jgi:hypothetical protein
MKHAFPFMCMLPLACLLHNPKAQGANYQLGTPFPITCFGTLEYDAGEYRLIPGKEDDGFYYEDEETKNRCQLAIVAEKSKGRNFTYTLKDKTIRRLLRFCSVGKRCEISGLMNGLSHDVYFWVQIYSIQNIPGEQGRK